MSGVGKLSQIVFGVVAPGNAVANIIAGAIAEAGAAQAGDLMQDLKVKWITIDLVVILIFFMLCYFYFLFCLLSLKNNEMPITTSI